MNLLNGLLDHFVDEVYASLGDLLDILALINNGVNFFLYCTMSKQFRDTFVHLFGCCRSRRSATSSKSINCETAEDAMQPIATYAAWSVSVRLSVCQQRAP